ncbi:unnamed protein product [Didymodactylos carnosus]|uniref:DUF4037 domain-containing protein n=1 Tax=Didymodactylos carnosus TaxID=1234261 RepID=A0A813SIZ2_9BILA|nr:unnamed protein product [Didymodactylos carnosus]CAF1550742.1 unnamed protein product [Didymodactylos carnosus]CAF3579757.1 unnamed protein product [Didymodactylos carnosus]CAF4340793.1 unnamed protein product [Didymodactylos carnosus]
MSNIPFIKGLLLCEEFFKQIIHPLLNKHFPTLQYAACRIGSGSDVLGYDTEISRDHDWGPKLELLLNDETFAIYNQQLDECFQQNLNGTICGYSMKFYPYIEDSGTTVFVNESTTAVTTVQEERKMKHSIVIKTMRQFFLDYLNWNIDDDITISDWLTFPSQHLLTIRVGKVFYDTVGLENIRSRLNYYPHDVWLYLLLASWQRIGQEEHLMCRAGQIGDELGATLIANRLIRDIMRLIFFIEKQFIPYSKWFGSAFQNLKNNHLYPILRQIQLADTFLVREKFFSEALEIVAKLHNELKLTDPLPIRVSQFFSRPFSVIWGGMFADKIFERIMNPEIKLIALKTKIGSIDLFVDSTDALLPEMRLKMKQLFTLH